MYTLTVIFKISILEAYCQRNIKTDVFVECVTHVVGGWTPSHGLILFCAMLDCGGVHMVDHHFMPTRWCVTQFDDTFLVGHVTARKFIWCNYAAFHCTGAHTLMCHMFVDAFSAGHSYRHYCVFRFPGLQGPTRWAVIFPKIPRVRLRHLYCIGVWRIGKRSHEAYLCCSLHCGNKKRLQGPVMTGCRTPIDTWE